MIARVAGDCLGLEQLESRPPWRRLRIWCESLAGARAAEAALLALFDCGAGETFRSRAVEVEDGRWVERYQERLRPFHVGARFVVFPTGERGASGERTPIVLAPGRAFGTGEHPTTRLCAEALEAWVRSGQSWVDLGTGSGILAVIAAHCGARSVLALDVDPVAIEVARKVVRANGVARRVRLVHQAAELAAGRAWDGVVANIETPFFLRSAPVLAGLLAPAGVLITAGFLAEDAPEISRRLALAGLDSLDERVREGWGALVHRRRPERSG